MEYSLTSQEVIEEGLDYVLILILMEYSLTAYGLKGLIVPKSLNPYSNGILPDIQTTAGIALTSAS